MIPIKQYSFFLYSTQLLLLVLPDLLLSFIKWRYCVKWNPYYPTSEGPRKLYRIIRISDKLNLTLLNNQVFNGLVYSCKFMINRGAVLILE